MGTGLDLSGLGLSRAVVLYAPNTLHPEERAQEPSSRLQCSSRIGVYGDKTWWKWVLSFFASTLYSYAIPSQIPQNLRSSLSAVTRSQSYLPSRHSPTAVLPTKSLSICICRFDRQESHGPTSPKPHLLRHRSASAGARQRFKPPAAFAGREACRCQGVIDHQDRKNTRGEQLCRQGEGERDDTLSDRMVKMVFGIEMLA